MAAFQKSVSFGQSWPAVKRSINRQITGYLFILPQLVLFFVFLLYPIIEGFRLSFYNVQVFGSRFVGFQNYVNVFQDPIFIHALYNTLFFIVSIVVLTVVFAIFVAAAIFDKSEAYISLIRGSYYLPVIVSMTVMSMVWAIILNPAGGLVNYISSRLGGGDIDLLGSPTSVMPVIIVLTFMVNVGQAIILYIAAFISIPPEILEAAEVDGANRWVRFRKILLPLSNSTTLYVTVTNIIAVLKIFVIIQLLTAGGPSNASVTLMYYMYQKAFQFNQVGQGCAVGIIMFVIALLLSIPTFKLIKTE